MSDNGFEAGCHCGNVNVTISQPPNFMHDCNCSLCRKSGGIWGYFEPRNVEIVGETSNYVRNDYSQPAVEIHFCGNCGSTTHWVLTDEHIQNSGQNEQMGVNMQLFDSADLDGVELRFPDGKNWFGHSKFGFRRPSVILGEGFVL